MNPVTIDTTSTVVVDIGEPASNTSTTRPPRVDPQPRPHRTTTTAVPSSTLPGTGGHPAATATGGLFVLAAGVAALVLARRTTHPNEGHTAQGAFHRQMRRQGWICHLSYPHVGPCPLHPVWWRHPIRAVRHH